MERVVQGGSTCVPRIVQLIPRDGVGGVEVAARSVAARVDLPCDYRLRVIARGPRSSLFDPRAHLAAAVGAVRARPDVLICSLWWSVPAALLAKLLRPRLRLVLFLHAERLVHVVDRWLTALALRCADAVWADALVTLTARAGSRSATGRVVSFVTDRQMPAIVSERAPRPRFVAWGRLAHQKGIDRAIRLVAALCEAGVDARFDIWGMDDGVEASLRQQVEELGLADRVFLHGLASRSELAAIAASGDFFLQLSRFEGMGMAVIEAMQLGLVPVVTPVGELARYVRSGDNGLIVDPEALERTVAKIAALLADPLAFARLRGQAIATWRDSPLHADDLCDKARALVKG